jgi:orotate phosphoribosyltransferase
MPALVTPADAKSRLVAILKQRSVIVGQTFKLASGRTSDFYCNLKPTMMDPEGAFLIGCLLADALADVKADAIGGLELGAVPLATLVAAMSHAKGRPLPAFFVRKQAKDHGTQSLVEGLKRGETLKGRRVVIVDDVMTTGGSSMKAVAAVQADGATVAHVIAVVDREEGAAQTFATAGLSFSALLTARELR